jgi:hypothetical protein
MNGRFVSEELAEGCDESSLARGRLGCRMQPVLRHFMYAAGRRFVVTAVEMIEGARAFADGKAIFNGFHHIGFREHHCFAQAAPQSQLRRNR